MRNVLLPTMVLSSLALTAGCSKKSDEPAAKATESASDKPAAKPADKAAVDLSPAGAAWAGFSVQGPSGAQVNEDGAGGVNVTFSTYGISLSQELNLPTYKDGLKFGAETTKGKLVYSVDKPDRIEFTTETTAETGAVLKGYGFAYYVEAGGKKIGCSATVDSEQQANAAKAVCNSIAKK